MVYLIAAFLSAISVAQSSSNDPCVTHDLNFYSPPDLFEYGSGVTGAALGAALGYALAKPAGYSYAEVWQSFQLDQTLMNESYSSIRKLQTAAEKLRSSYSDYYQHYGREVLRPMLAERIEPAQNTFFESLNQLYQTLAKEQGRSEIAALVTSHRHHITLSVLKDLRSAMTDLHEPHLKENSYSAIAEEYVMPFDQTLDEFIDKLDAAIPCEEDLDSEETLSKQQQQVLLTVAGGAAGGIAGWLGAGLVKSEVEKIAESSLLPVLCARLDKLRNSHNEIPREEIPAEPLHALTAPPEPRPIEPPREIKIPRGHELDR